MKLQNIKENLIGAVVAAAILILSGCGPQPGLRTSDVEAEYDEANDVDESIDQDFVRAAQHMGTLVGREVDRATDDDEAGPGSAPIFKCFVRTHNTNLSKPIRCKSPYSGNYIDLGAKGLDKRFRAARFSGSPDARFANSCAANIIAADCRQDGQAIKPLLQVKICKGPGRGYDGCPELVSSSTNVAQSSAPAPVMGPQPFNPPPASAMGPLPGPGDGFKTVRYGDVVGGHAFNDGESSGSRLRKTVNGQAVVSKIRTGTRLTYRINNTMPSAPRSLVTLVQNTQAKRMGVRKVWLNSRLVFDSNVALVARTQNLPRNQTDGLGYAAHVGAVVDLPQGNVKITFEFVGPDDESGPYFRGFQIR